MIWLMKGQIFRLVIFFEVKLKIIDDDWILFIVRKIRQNHIYPPNHQQDLATMDDS
jgi:hypothetical protein